MAESCLVHLYHEKQLAALTEKQDKAESRLGALEMSISEMAAKIEGSGTVQDKILATLEELKGKPGKRWDQVITTTIGVIVTGLIMYAINKLG